MGGAVRYLPSEIARTGASGAQAFPLSGCPAYLRARAMPSIEQVVGQFFVSVQMFTLVFIKARMSENFTINSHTLPYLLKNQ